MVHSIVRTDRWLLNPSRQTTEHLAATIVQYRAFGKALTYVVYGHWVEIKSAKSQCVAVERLIHKTKSNPTPRYQYFGECFYKFPSYLRRAAIEFVCGQVSRDKSNYSNATFQTGKRYNCDLSASYNIAARYWAHKLKLTRRKDGRLLDGKSTFNKQRMPATLSLLWKPSSSIVLD